MAPSPAPREPVALEALHADDAPKLAALACVLGRAQRRLRFGAGVNDEYILRHFATLDWRRYAAVGAFARRRLEAVVETYDVGRDKSLVELAAFGLPRAETRWGADLAALAVRGAMQRGAVRFVLAEPDARDPWGRVLGSSLSPARPSGEALALFQGGG